MAEPFLGEVRAFGFNFAPRGWAFCNGQTLPINQNQALFALLGTTYGGNGTTTFQLPNLQASMPIHVGDGFSLGNQGGETAHTLTLTEIPAHTHVAQGTSATATSPEAANNIWATSVQNPYATSSNVNMAPGAVSTVGGSQPHNNMAPYLTLNFCIALSGIFPTQN
jgi:microcystin-dependent protein